MKYETFIRKDIRGAWKATTVAPFNDGTHRELHVTTRKLSQGSGLYCNASVHVHNGNFLEHMVYQDFSVLVRQAPKVRCTDKNVEALHPKADEVAALLARARAHYAGVPA